MRLIVNRVLLLQFTSFTLPLSLNCSVVFRFIIPQIIASSSSSFFFFLNLLCQISLFSSRMMIGFNLNIEQRKGRKREN